ncbi:MAG TPA: pyroglutamyl-peptidase I [Dokdonella sp.]|uniref:pyroglutamyl-peptidase I n=1 Tax=Dokdonella sp. TaxID=2291710 RepID=UPI0025BFD228|nr:pyroglutamyl-peptidase I [Dokdonella sp.]MBX3693467.1 pyroglutamyl-peptidase I [Dokdonella sp.]MCW5568535.1 pyroglutamyl-peptidase I [Dokdonella sp.]HNR92049.1 pyroglutamyl-peptidase I [Dokdonella sp.]
MPCVLVTGFEAFDGQALNPSREIARCLDGTTIAGHAIVGAVLPVTFAEAPAVLAALVERHEPVLVLATGQAGGRAALTLERVAINLADARIADNAGTQPVDAAVVADAPAAYFSDLPLKAMREAMRTAGAATELSLSAGSFVCNQVFYTLCHLRETRAPSLRCGFLHLPWLPAQVIDQPAQPSMDLDTMLAGVRAALECALSTHADLPIGAGPTH